MDRSHSLQFVPIQPELCPWQSREDDNFLQNLQKTDIQLRPKTKSNYQLNPRTQQFKQARVEKFSKIIEQHRERILKRKATHNSTVSLQKLVKQPCMRQNTHLKIKHRQSQHQQSQHLDTIPYGRSNTMNKLSEQAIEIKQFSSKLSTSHDQDREIIKQFYRTRTLNKNADKYFGNLNKKIEVKQEKSRSILSHKEHRKQQQIPIITSTHTKFYSQTNKPKNPVQSIVEIKLVNYRSSKSIQNFIKQIRQSKADKSKLSKQQKNHVLDKILVNR